MSFFSQTHPEHERRITDAKQRRVATVLGAGLYPAPKTQPIEGA